MINTIKIFEEKTTPYLQELSKTSDAIRKLYFYNPEKEGTLTPTNGDLLNETEHTVVKGLVHKYKDRVLALLSYTCAANCRFCERQGRVGVGLDKEGFLKEEDIENIFQYVKSHEEIHEVVFSGGDPLMNPKGLLLACQKLSTLEHVKRLRIHTKLPISGPDSLDYKLLQTLIDLPKTFYLSIHVNHPDELTPQSIDAINKIRKMGYIMLDQSVFLKGINDNLETLKELFSTLADLGVRPYYIYHCNTTPSTQHFAMDVEDEISLMSQLREELSGIAFPQHCIDAQDTTGKVVVPTNHFSFNHTEIRDFENKKYNIK